MDNVTSHSHGLIGYMNFQVDNTGIITKGNRNFCTFFNVDTDFAEISVKDIFSAEDLVEVLKYNNLVFETKSPSLKRHVLKDAPFFGKDLLFYRTLIVGSSNNFMNNITVFCDDVAVAKFLDFSDFERLVDDADINESFVSITDAEGNFQNLSDNVKQVLGYSKLDMIGRSRAMFMEKNHRKEMLDQFDSYFKNRLPVHGLKNIVQSKDGRSITLISSAKPIFNRTGTFIGYKVLNQDISILVQDDLPDGLHSKEINSTLKSIKQNFIRMNQTLKLNTDIQSVVSKVSSLFMSTPIDKLSNSIHGALEIIGETTGVDRVYIFELHDERRKLSNTYEWCYEGIEPMIDILQNLDSDVFSWSMKRFSLGEAINIYDVHLMSEEAQAEKEILQEQGIQSILLVPLTDNKELIGFIGFDSVKSKKEWDSEVSMIKVLSDIFSRTLIRMRNEHLLVDSALKTKQILEQTIESFSSIVEINDPYTSGHQNRTAELANRIAEKIGLGGQSRELLNYSSLLHDLGKFYIPSQILNKPGKLSEIEFSLIKTHPSLGFQILKRIDFPWPIADVVIQHHERIDGSGYPYGLIGDEIMIEARILAVADVVESMSSHRPYRPALGIHAALDEIRKNSGVIYDSKVAKACIELFEKDNFRFSRFE